MTLGFNSMFLSSLGGVAKEGTGVKVVCKNMMRGETERANIDKFLRSLDGRGSQIVGRASMIKRTVLFCFILF